MVKACVFLVNKTGLADKNLVAALTKAIGAGKTIKPATAPIFFKGDNHLEALVETTTLTVTVCAVESQVKNRALEKAIRTAAKNKVPFFVAKPTENGEWKIINTSAPASKREFAIN